MPTTTKSVTGVRYLWEDNRIVDILRLDRTYTRDNRGRFASGGGGGGGSSGGGKSGGGKKGGGGGLTSMKASELQKIASDEGIDINTLSHKRRKSVLAAAIEAKRKGKDLREEGLLKAQKPQSSLAKKRSQSKGKGKKEESISDRVKQVNAANKKPTGKTTKPKSTKSAGKKPNLNGSQADFEDAAFQVMADLSAKHDKNPKKSDLTSAKQKEGVILSQDDGVLVPIYQIRRAMGEDVGRKEFNDRMAEMQAKGKVQLMGGEVLGVSPSQLEDSITLKAGKLRYFAKVTPEGSKDLIKTRKSPRTNAEKYKKQSTTDLESESKRQSIVNAQKKSLLPKNADLKSEKGFEDATKKLFKDLNEQFNLDYLVPIHEIRSIMGNKVSDAEFDRKLLNLQSQGYSLKGGEVLNATGKYKLKTPLGTERFFISKD